MVLKVSNGSQAKIDMPDIVGMTEGEAVSALRNAGWNSTHSSQFSPRPTPIRSARCSTAARARQLDHQNQQIVLYIGADRAAPPSRRRTTTIRASHSVGTATAEPD